MLLCIYLKCSNNVTMNTYMKCIYHALVYRTQLSMHTKRTPSIQGVVDGVPLLLKYTEEIY